MLAQDRQQRKVFEIAEMLPTGHCPYKIEYRCTYVKPQIIPCATCPIEREVGRESRAAFPHDSGRVPRRRHSAPGQARTSLRVRSETHRGRPKSLLRKRSACKPRAGRTRGVTARRIILKAPAVHRRLKGRRCVKRRFPKYYAFCRSPDPKKSPSRIAKPTCSSVNVRGCPSKLKKWYAPKINAAATVRQAPIAAFAAMLPGMLLLAHSTMGLFGYARGAAVQTNA
jgi:hypothetical protein